MRAASLLLLTATYAQQQRIAIYVLSTGKSKRLNGTHTEPLHWLTQRALPALDTWAKGFDRVVFVEPPWSNQLRCCLYDTNATFSFVVGLDRYGDVRVDVAEGEFVREHFGHVFWRDGERRTGGELPPDEEELVAEDVRD